MNAWPVHTFETWEDFQEGQVLLIDKPLEWTSFDVVNKLEYAIRKSGGFRKIQVGHAGTLDPLATGVLVVRTGRMTKRINELTAEDKAYDGHITFGSTTDSHDRRDRAPTSGDTSGLARRPPRRHRSTHRLHPTGAAAVQRQESQQPEGLHRRRKGKDIALRTAGVIVHRFDITDWTCPVMSFDILCSKGTYIPSHRPGCRQGRRRVGATPVRPAAHLTSGAFKLEDCLSIDAFLERLQALPHAPAPKAD